MLYIWYIFLLATLVSADYYIDNANTSVVYSMPASQSGQAWQTFSVGTQSLALSISNSTGNYTIPLDASHCYDQNYALGVCGTSDGCFVEVPFTGSGITMYVFNAGLTGMTAGFSVDGGTAISSTIQGPPPPTYQISNVSLYDIQGPPTGNHTMKMTLLDWNGGGTSMKFDYAYVNETFVAPPAATSSTSGSMTSTAVSQTATQTPTGNSAASNGVNVGGIVGATLGGLAFLVGLVIGFLYLRKRKATPQPVFSPQSTFQVNPFTSEYSSPTIPFVPHAHQVPFSSQPLDASPSIVPLTRTAILRDALAAGNYPSSGPDQTSQSVRSGHSSGFLQPLRRQPSQSGDADTPIRPSTSQVAEASSPFTDSASRYNLTAEQVRVVDQLRLDNMPVETIARVIEGYVSSNLSTGSFNERKAGPSRERSFVSAAPPPSYQTREG